MRIDFWSQYLDHFKKVYLQLICKSRSDILNPRIILVWINKLLCNIFFESFHYFIHIECILILVLLIFFILIFIIFFVTWLFLAWLTIGAALTALRIWIWFVTFLHGLATASPGYYGPSPFDSTFSFDSALSFMSSFSFNSAMPLKSFLTF